MRVVALVLWAACGAMAAVVALARDALVALPGEDLATAAAMVLAHLALGAGLTLGLARGRRRWPALLPPLALGVAWAALWVPAPPRPTAAARSPSIALVTLDTFRADNLGPFGGQAETPVLDALAADGLLFTNAVATAPLTAPSHASMLTGLGTRAHGLMANGGTLQDGASVVPRLSAAGYRTGAFLSSRVLDRGTGLAAGFGHYDDRWGWRQRFDWFPGLKNVFGRGRPAARVGDETVERALTWIREGEGPFLLWVHLYDAHAPYLAPPGWRPSREEQAEAAALDRAERPHATDRASFTRNLEQGFAHGQRLLYRSAARWTDHLVGQLVAGLPPETVLVVVADHGESLGEHDYWFNHGGALWEPSMHVPLILRWPGQVPGGQQSDALVGVDRVAGLLLGIAGLEELDLEALVASAAPIPQYTPGQQARSRFGRPPGDGQPVAALRMPRAKLLVQGDSEPVYYDLDTDPVELDPQPVPQEHAAEADALRRVAAEAPAGPDAQQSAWLEAIGYTGW
ncbi:MAG: sulfatase [Pseudomonadota bacterium]